MDNETEKETPETNEEMETPETPKTEKTEEKSKELQSALAQKEHFREKSEKLEAELAKTRQAEPNPKTATPAVQDPVALAKLAKTLGAYNEEEIDFIIRNAQSKSPDGIIQAAQDKWVQTAIQAEREKVEKGKTPPPSTKQTPGGKVKLSDLSSAEQREYLEDMGLIRKRPV